MFSRVRGRAGLAAVLAAAAFSTAGIAPAAALAPGETCHSAGYDCTGSLGYAGQGVWGANYGVQGHNCTSWTSYRLSLTGMAQPSSPMGDGATWDDYAARAGYTVDTYPTVGSIIQWDGRNHVAVVEVVTPDAIEYTEDNYGLNYTARVRLSRSSSVYQAAKFIHYNDAVPLHLTGDWDGNGTDTEAVVYRTPSGLQWHLRNTIGGGPADAVFYYGSPTDIPVVGDWDGVGGDTIGVARRVAGQGLQWHLRNYNSAGPANAVFFYGAQTDNPVVGNWDNNGGDSIGVARPVAGQGLQWHLRNSNSAGPADAVFFYGAQTDLPVVGDWDGVGGDTIGVARRVPGQGLQWHLRNYNSGGPANAVFFYGSDTDMPQTGDWDNYGGDTIGVARVVFDQGIQWHLRNYNSSGPVTYQPFLYGGSLDSTLTTA